MPATVVMFMFSFVISFTFSVFFISQVTLHWILLMLTILFDRQFVFPFDLFSPFSPSHLVFTLMLILSITRPFHTPVLLSF